MFSIEIDFEVFKEITARRASENITPNDVLRDILGLSKRQIPKVDNQLAKRPWTVKSVTFTHGAEFRSVYKGKTYHARVEDGALLLNGKRFTSPSAAAMSITGSAVNGWIFWECKLPGETNWKLIKNFRSS